MLGPAVLYNQCLRLDGAEDGAQVDLGDWRIVPWTYSSPAVSICRYSRTGGQPASLSGMMYLKQPTSSKTLSLEASRAAWERH